MKREVPKFKVGDLVEIYSGDREGHGFWVKGIRFNQVIGQFEYCYGVPLLGGWHPEKNLTLLAEKRA